MAANSEDKFSGLIELIKKCVAEDGVGIGIKDYNHFKDYGWVYGKLDNGFITEPFKLDITDTSNLCQDLRDSLVAEFGDEIKPGYSTGHYWQYLMSIGENVIVFFPEGREFADWSYNQAQKDNEAQREQKKR